MSEIHWPTELRKIEREFDGLPPELTPAEERARRDSERLAEQLEHEKVAGVGGAVRLMLVLALGAALDVWPYSHECGAGLYAYMGAASVLVLGGLWVAAYTWRGRAARIHILSLVTTLWGLTVLSAQVLPRVGYAKVDPSHPPVWACGAPASPAPPAAPAPEIVAPAPPATSTPTSETGGPESTAPESPPPETAASTS